LSEGLLVRCRGHSPDLALLRQTAVDLQGLFGKVVPHVLEIILDIAAELRPGLQGRFTARGRGRALLDGYRRRCILDPGVVAIGTGDLPRGELALEVLAAGKPSFESMVLDAPEIKDYDCRSPRSRPLCGILTHSRWIGL
jgi:hypothetical protein